MTLIIILFNLYLCKYFLYSKNIYLKIELLCYFENKKNIV